LQFLADMSTQKESKARVSQQDKAH
jgi:hypothetical protein